MTEHNAGQGESKRRSAEEILRDHGIRLDSHAPGRHYAVCPECSHRRSTAEHRKAKVLGVTIDHEGVNFGCNHCGWTGGKSYKANGRARGEGFAATYNYDDANGRLVFQKLRNPPGRKPRFWCRRPDGRGGWINNTKGIKRKPLYRWPEVREAMQQRREIAIAEGEKDCDGLWRIGIPATCNFDGAAPTCDDHAKPLKHYKPKWRPEYSEQLAGARLIVFNDNDEPGRAHADAVCRMSIGIAERVRRLDLAPHWPDMPEGADVSDWLANGGTREKLDALIEEAPDFSAGPEPSVDPQRGLPVIKIVGGEIARVVDEAEAALLEARVPFMVRAGMLVYPITETLQAADNQKTEATVLRAVRPENIIYMLNKHAAVFLRYDGRAQMWVRTDPPYRVATSLLQKGQWPFPRATGVITTPTMRPDGTILDQPGHDPATQLWYAPDKHLRVPPIKAQPTREDALTALKLFEDLLTGFPFVDDVDRVVALAALLTPPLRAACDVVPMFLFLAHVAGSGKSYLTDLISTIAHGRKAAAISKATNEEELEKRLGALVLAGVPTISIDNCTTNLSGTTLCQVTERQLVSIRILGKSEMPECEYRGAIFANGNNVTVEGDLTRRTVVCHMDAGVERPELRKFDFDPIARVLGDRGAYIAAALTIARAYRVSGEQVECDPIASYGRWSKVVREPLIWLGKEDPLRSMDEIREEDPVRAAARELYGLWKEHLGVDKAYTAAQLVAEALAHPELNALLMAQAGGFKSEIDVRRAGIWLNSVHGQVHDSHRLTKVKEGNNHRGAIYALKRVAAQAELWEDRP
jgi:putative DNA primase/helicase